MPKSKEKKTKAKKGSKKGASPAASQPPVADAFKAKAGSRESLVRRASKVGGSAGINWDALDKAAKKENTINRGSGVFTAAPGKDDHSKIYKALNPDKLWKETAREKAEATADENVMVVQLRGSDARTLLDQQTFTRDDTGAIVDDDENDLGFGTATIESGGIGIDEMEDILAEKRKEREAEALKRRQQLQAEAKKKESEKQKKINEELKQIEKKERRLSVKKQVTEKDVKMVQDKLEKELEFEEFGFGD